MILQVPALEPDGREWPSLGGLVCAWIEENLVFGPGDLLGQPAVIDEEKRFLIWRAYEVHPPGHEQAGRRRFKKVAVSESKGSAKTELLGWVTGVEIAPDAPARCDGFRKDGSLIWRPVVNPYVPLCAYTEQQSEELAYGALREILMRSKIADRFDIGLERIVRIGKGGRPDGKCEAVATAPNSRDGARTTFQGFDETHRFTTPTLRSAYQTMMQNIPKRRLSDAWTMETTTAYEPGQKSIAEATHQYAKAVEDGRIKDSKLFYFHRQAGDGYDLQDREQRRKAVIEAAGPMAPWRDVDGITDLYDDPTTDRAYWERVQLNRPTKGGSKAFNVEQWRALKREREIPAGALVTLGFDGARYDDASGLVATEVETGFQQTLGVWERPINAPKDWEVPEAEVTAAVDAAFVRWSVWALYADPPYWEATIAAWSGQHGEKLVVKWHTKWTEKMVEAVRAFNNAVKDRKLTHDGHEAYDRHVANAHRRDSSKRDEKGELLWTIYKERPDSPLKIDCAVAGILSWQARLDALAEGVEPPPPPQDYRVDWV